MLTYAAGGMLWRGAWRPVAERGAPGGFCFGGVGAFLVLESPAHARARGATPIARLSALHTAMAHRRGADTAAASGAALLAQLQPRLRPGAAALSTASGVAGITADELALLRGAGLAPECLGDLLGHAPEASFPAAVALAALAAAARAARRRPW
jgi:3-oxoacyl-[acyl-carrier-protein] synthase II